MELGYKKEKNKFFSFKIFEKRQMKPKEFETISYVGFVTFNVKIFTYITYYRFLWFRWLRIEQKIPLNHKAYWPSEKESNCRLIYEAQQIKVGIQNAWKIWKNKKE